MRVAEKWSVAAMENARNEVIGDPSSGYEVTLGSLLNHNGGECEDDNEDEVDAKGTDVDDEEYEDVEDEVDAKDKMKESPAKTLKGDMKWPVTKYVDKHYKIHIGPLVKVIDHCGDLNGKGPVYEAADKAVNDLSMALKKMRKGEQ